MEIEMTDSNVKTFKGGVIECLEKDDADKLFRGLHGVSAVIAESVVLRVDTFVSTASHTFTRGDMAAFCREVLDMLETTK